MPSPDRTYCDTSVFMSYFNENPERLTVLGTLFDNISNNDSGILITSVITKVEVSWIETAEYKPVKADDLARLDNFWKDSNVIQLVEFNDNIADIARDLMRHARNNGWSTKTWGIDSIHLATAKWANAKSFFTYDTKFAKFADYIGIKIDEPKPGQLIMNV